MGHRVRGSLLLLCLASLATACGGTTEAPGQHAAAQAPPFGATLSTGCAANGTDWLDVEAQLPGRWSYGGMYMEVGIDLRASWGRSLQSSDVVEGTSVWSRDAEGMIEEIGAGPCADGSECGARFVRRGTLAADDRRLAFYALWPIDPCQQGLAGRYEGRDRFENNRATQGDLRLWSERTEQLTLEADGSWFWVLESKTYASVNDMGTVYWLAEPRIESGEDRGTYRLVDGAVSFTRQALASQSTWLSAAAGQSVELQLIGRALPYRGVSTYERAPP